MGSCSNFFFIATGVLGTTISPYMFFWQASAVPLLFLIARIASNRQVMGQYRSGIVSTVLVWCTFGGMGAAAVAMFFTLAKG